MRSANVRAKARDLNLLACMIWTEYPRKTDEVAGKQAVKKILSTGTMNVAKVDYEYLLSAVKEYATAVATWPEEKLAYVPKLSSWIMQGKFNDDRKEWYRNGAKANKQPSGEFNRPGANSAAKVYRGFEGKGTELDLQV